ncbi:MAG: superoxide dismutase [Epsilonproteobacteria bacterium (ex Lamellibrachia satsuma)]|nr:MAG: superoxide dismutase [Epsilonproteobacteria bacterium (ex Lamellibrachia satsuma)]
MVHTLMKLPFNENALEPYISKETIQYHYDKHHAGYVNKLNSLIENTEYAEMTLEEIIKKSAGNIFNNASQIYNHDFYFKGMSSKENVPSNILSEWIERDFGSMEEFKKHFLQTAVNLFGSGWAWLSIDKKGNLVIEARSNADNPLLDEHIPLLTCDVWEHAYYIVTPEKPKHLPKIGTLEVI